MVSLRSAGDVADPVSHGEDIGDDDWRGRRCAEALGQTTGKHAVEHLSRYQRVPEVTLKHMDGQVIRLI